MDTQNPTYDLGGQEIHAGDGVQIEGVVEKVNGDKLRIVFENGEENEYFLVTASRAKKTNTARIGAAPKQRTGVDEIPNPLGGVKIVPRGSETGKTEEIPNVHPAARRAIAEDEEPGGDTKPEGQQAPKEDPNAPKKEDPNAPKKNPVLPTTANPASPSPSSK